MEGEHFEIFDFYFLQWFSNALPSISDVHTGGGGEGVRLRWTHVDRGGSQAPCGRPHRKLKLESTDVILSSSHAKKLVYFYQNFVFGRNKEWTFFGDIN